MHHIFGTDYYISFQVCSLLISMYKNIELFYNKINKNDFIATVKENNHVNIYTESYKNKPLLNAKYMNEVAVLF